MGRIPTVPCEWCEGRGHFHVAGWERVNSRPAPRDGELYSDFNGLEDCEACGGTGEVRNPATYCRCCAEADSVENAPELVDGRCPACVETECACVTQPTHREDDLRCECRVCVAEALAQKVAP